MKEYRIKTAIRSGEDYQTMMITDRQTGDLLAEYRLTSGQEAAEISAMRRTLDRHIESGGCLDNYQF